MADSEFIDFEDVFEEEEDDQGQRMVELKHNQPDHRDAVQKKTFTKWVNNRLLKVGVRILDLYEELRDGEDLLLLLEVLCNVKLPRERGLLRFHMLQNVQTALEFLESKKIKLVNIRSDDIVDGNPKLTLGLIWTIILYFQINDLDVEIAGEKVQDLSAKDALLHWSKKVTQGYPKVDVKNFSSSWRDGFAFNAIIHRYRPDLVDFSKLSKTSPEANIEYAFHVAEKELNVPRLLDVEDVVVSENPDEKSIMTYVASLYEVFPRTPTVQESLHDNEKQLKYEEYCNYAKNLVDLVNDVISNLEKQKIPRTIQGIKELILAFNRYRITEYPDMVATRHSIKMLYKNLQVLYGPMTTWLDFPKDCSPRELEVLWTNLVDTQESYNKSLRIELTRLEQMSQVAEKIHKEAILVDGSLDDIEDRIKMEEQLEDSVDVQTRRKSFTTIEKSLVMFESSIKHMISGSDILVAGKYPRAEDLQARVRAIDHRWNRIRAHLGHLANQLRDYKSVTTGEGKRMKMEVPLTQAAAPESMDAEDAAGPRGTKKVITVTKRTYKSATGEPLETRTTVSRVTSSLPPEERVSLSFLSSDSLPSSDSGISPGSSPQGRKIARLQFNIDKSRNKRHTLDSMLQWVREKKASLEMAEYGLDLPSTQKCLQEHHGEHDLVIAFDDELAAAKKYEVGYESSVNTSARGITVEDPSLKPKILELHEEYVTLVTASVERMRHLKSLVEFMSEATKELIWMNQREEPEVSRDWARADLDLADLATYGQELLLEIKDHEPHYQGIVAKGNGMVQSGHPAPGPIEAYLSAMSSQWWWINQLTLAFDEHLKNAQIHQQFQGDAQAAEQKMVHFIDQLNTVYGVQSIPDKQTATSRLHKLGVELSRVYAVRTLHSAANVIRWKNSTEAAFDHEKILHDSRWERFWRERVLPADSELSHSDIPLDAFPVVRQTKLGVVVAYSLDYVKDIFARKASEPSVAGPKERYVLLLRSPKLDTQVQLEPLFKDVVTDMLQFKQEMKQELIDYKDIISSLQLLSKQVTPMKQRKSKLRQKTSVKAVCSYKNMQNTVEQGEEYTLFDNTEHHAWKVASSPGEQSEVPSVCFVIPAPDLEAIDFATRLEIQYKHLLTLWRTRHSNLKQALAKEQVFTNIKVVKSTIPHQALPQLALAGSKDVEQLLKEMQDGDQEIIGITEQLVSEQAPESTDGTAFSRTYQTPQAMDEQKRVEQTLKELTKWLNDTHSLINTKSEETLNMDHIPTQLQEIKDLQDERVTTRQPQLEALQTTLTAKMDPHLQRKLETVVTKWKATTCSMDEWQKMLEFVLHVTTFIRELSDWLHRVEIILIQQPGLTADLREVQAQLSQLESISEKEIIPRLNKIEDVQLALPQLRELDRAHTQDLLDRWDQVTEQVDERMRRLARGLQGLHGFQTPLAAERTWLDEAELKAEELRSAEEHAQSVEQRMEELTNFYTEVCRHETPVKTCTTDGDDYTNESKDFEDSLERYRRSLHHLPESREKENSALGAARRGRETIRANTAETRLRYERLMAEVQGVMEAMVDVLKKEGPEHKEVEAACLDWCSSIQRLLDWVSDTEKTLVQQDASPADVRQLEEQIEEQKKLTRAINERKRPVESALKQGERFLQGRADQLGPEARGALDSKMTSLEARWNRLQNELDNRYMKLVLIHEKLTRFEELLHPFLAWLKRAEEHRAVIMNNVNDSQTAQERLYTHKNFVEDVKDHERDLKEVNHCGEDFLHEAKVFQAELERSVATLGDDQAPSEDLGNPNDKSWVLEKKLSDINERYNRLLVLLTERGTYLDRSWKQLRDYDTKASQVLPWLSSAEERLARKMAQPIGRDPSTLRREIDELKAFQAEVNSHQPEVISVDVLGHSIERVAPTSGKPVRQRYDELCTNIAQYEARLQSALTNSQNFKDGLDGAIRALQEVKKHLGKLEPVSSTLAELRTQAQQFKVYQNEINKHGTTVDALNEMFQGLKKKQKESKLKQLNKLWDEVRGMAESRRADMKSVFVMIAKDFERWELTMIKRLDSGELVTSDILVFEEKLQNFKDEVERMRPALQGVNQGGHELLNLERTKLSVILETLDRVNKDWQTLCVKLMNTSSKLDELQEQSEKFYNVLRIITTWLNTTEVTLVSMATVCVDPDVLGQQITQQKALQDEAVQYKARLDLLNGLGKVIITMSGRTDHAPAPGTHPIEQDLDAILARYDEVWKSMEARRFLLETTLLQMERYRRQVKSVTIFLNRAEKKQKEQDPVGCDADTIQKQISEHKTLQRDLQKAHADMESLLKSGNELMQGRESVPGSEDVREEMDHLKSRLDHVTVTSLERQKELESTWSAVKHFTEAVSVLDRRLKNKFDEIDMLMKAGADSMDVYKGLKRLESDLDQLTYQMTTARESGDDMIRHLHSTHQDTTAVRDKLDDVNTKWSDFQKRLKELTEYLATKTQIAPQAGEEGTSTEPSQPEVQEVTNAVTLQDQPVTQSFEPTSEEEKVEEYVDEYGHVIRCITRRTLVIKRYITDDNGHKNDLPDMPPEEFPPNSEVHEFVDKNGRIVRRSDPEALDTSDIPPGCDIEELIDEEGRTVKRVVKRHILVRVFVYNHEGQLEEIKISPEELAELSEPSWKKKPLKMSIASSKIDKEPDSEAVGVSYPLETSEREKEFVDVHGRIIKTIITRSVIRTWIVFDEKGNHVQDTNAPESEELPTDCELEDVSDEQGRVVRRIVKRYIVVKVFIINHEGQLEEIEISPEEKADILESSQTQTTKPSVISLDEKPLKMNVVASKTPSKEVAPEKREPPQPLSQAIEVDFPLETSEQEKQFVDVHGRIIKTIITRSVIRTWIVFDEEGNHVQDTNAPESEELPTDCELEDVSDEQGRVVRRIVKSVAASKTPSKEVAPEKREPPQPLSQAIEVDFPLETSEQEKQFVDVHGRIIKTIITRSVIRTWIVFDEEGNPVQDTNAPESEELPTDCELEDVSDEQGHVVRRIVKRYIVVKVFIINQEGQLEEIEISPEEKAEILESPQTQTTKPSVIEP
ncbi:predicted protein [Nematostella vectensis]|uniref:Calponin-homology (CH) domain-containing protein n=1 Tax=Nematostella vectensis TaxID=45351 RepID=A7SF38_NEMVE|nr:predicted protein [Nematostella vectensis]|eukprot:XP_001629771.1 predicted protein [Nematostella vectensis]